MSWRHALYVVHRGGMFVMNQLKTEEFGIVIITVWDYSIMLK